MEADIQNPSEVNRFCVDGAHETDIIEWNNKRKLHSDHLDLLRPKHKCWIGNSSSKHDDLMFDQNPELEGMHIYIVKGRTDAALLDDNSEPESAKDSNSFTEDSNTSMSVTEEGKLEADSAKTHQNVMPSNSFVDWDGYKIKDNHFSLDVSAVEKVYSGEEDTSVDKEHNPSYHYADLHSLKNLEDQFPGLGSCTDHMYSEYSKDIIEEAVDKEFEDIFYSKGSNPNTYVLSSGRWNVNQEAESSTRPPTIDQEFEQYFSMLML